MSDFTANNLIHNLLKQADMASQPGTVNIKKRGLQFHVFDRNRMKQRLSKLPQVVKESIERQILEFDKAFSKISLILFENSPVLFRGCPSIIQA